MWFACPEAQEVSAYSTVGNNHGGRHPLQSPFSSLLALSPPFHNYLQTYTFS